MHLIGETARKEQFFFLPILRTENLVPFKSSVCSRKYGGASTISKHFSSNATAAPTA